MIMILVKNISKSVTATILLLLETKNQEKNTELSKYIREMKNSNINYDLKWSIGCKVHPYTGVSRKRELCLTEKLAIRSGVTI